MPLFGFLSDLFLFFDTYVSVKYNFIVLCFNIKVIHRIVLDNYIYRSIIKV